MQNKEKLLYYTIFKTNNFWQSIVPVGCSNRTTKRQLKDAFLKQCTQSECLKYQKRTISEIMKDAWCELVTTDEPMKIWCELVATEDFIW